MARVTNAVAVRRRRKRVLKLAKGQFGHRSRRFRQAKKSLIKGMRYQFRDRKVKKREFRRLWIVRINAACQQEGISYSRFIQGLKAAKVDINRKMMADCAVNSAEVFKKLVLVAKGAN